MIFINNEKLNKIKLNKSNFYVVIDFDRTITETNSCQSWNVCNSVLDDNFKKKSKELVEKYEPIEVDYTISFEEKNKAMIEWYSRSMNVFYEFHLTNQILMESVSKSNISFREGAKEFLKNMYENHIPVIIVSAGIGNVIEECLKQRNCLYENISIISNFIKFDENGNMKKYDTKIIHSLNKNMDEYLSDLDREKIQDKSYCLLVGDLVEDKTMVDSSVLEKSILVGFLNQNIKANLEVYKENFDIVLSENDGTFKVLSKLIQI